MRIRALAIVAAVAAALTGGAKTAAAALVFVDLGQSSQNLTLYGQGPIAPGIAGIGSFKVGQGSSLYVPGTDTSTFVLSGAIAGGSPGYDSGTYVLVTTYAGMNTPEAGPKAPLGQSNPSDLNEFIYSALDSSTTMTLNLSGTPTGNHVIPIVIGGGFAWPGFSVLFASATCTGVASCDQNTVGLTPGATIFGPVTISASWMVAAPEPATWAMMLLGFGGLGLAARRARRVNERRAA